MASRLRPDPSTPSPRPRETRPPAAPSASELVDWACLAIRANDALTLDALLRNGLPADASASDGQSLMAVAVRCGSLEAAIVLAAHGADETELLE